MATSEKAFQYAVDATLNKLKDFHDFASTDGMDELHSQLVLRFSDKRHKPKMWFLKEGLFGGEYFIKYKKMTFHVEIDGKTKKSKVRKVAGDVATHKRKKNS